MSSSSGFIWYDLMTTDVPAALAFYQRVVGWTGKDAGLSDRSYTMLSMGETGFGGAMLLPAEANAAGARPGWLGYIGVDDVDAVTARVTAAGGAVHHAPEDIPGVGRFAVLADPQGAVFMLFKGAMDEPMPPRPAPGTPGFTGWHELRAADGPSAFDFYSGLFGWTRGEAMDMGPRGVYQLFTTGGAPVGGIFTKEADTPVPFWLFYFTVPNIDAAIAEVTAGGGQVTNGPMEVPGGDWIVHCHDPQGAMFALVGKRG
jgi:predicted enzyme related to lactoylglutathione lyase